MERARVRGTHLPPEESRRKQPGKGAAGSQTVVETVSLSLALSLLYNPCTFISLCVHLFRAIYGKSRWYAYRCVISVVTGISRSSRPLPSRCLWATERNKYVYLPLHPQPIWCRTLLVLCILCCLEIILIPLISPSDHKISVQVIIPKLIQNYKFLFVEKCIDHNKKKLYALYFMILWYFPGMTFNGFKLKF